jgi:hypothetical protein
MIMCSVIVFDKTSLEIVFKLGVVILMKITKHCAHYHLLILIERSHETCIQQREVDFLPTCECGGKLTGHVSMYQTSLNSFR